MRMATIDALRHSVTLNDSDAGAFNTLGLLLKRKGDSAGAKEAFAKAAALRQAEADKKAKARHDGAARIPK
jgi:Flp pilus assembly protein TadD